MTDANLVAVQEAPAIGTRRRDLLLGALVGGVGTYAATNLNPLLEGAGFKPRGFSRARVIARDRAPLPSSVDVAIIGGGFAGVCSALSLARKGLSVAVFEKGVVAGEASGRAAGMVECIYQEPAHLNLIEMAKQHWRGLDAVIGQPTSFMQRGNAELFESEEELEGAKAWLDAVKGSPVGGARIIGKAEALAMAPGTNRPLIGGIWAPEDGSAEPELAVPALAEGARKFGARIIENCAVRAVETEAGRVSGVVTERGAVRAKHVVLAGGIWSPALAGKLGLDLPLAQGWVSMARMGKFAGAPATGSVNMPVAGIGWRPQCTGDYAIWQFVSISPVLPPSVSHATKFLPLLRSTWGMVGYRFSPESFIDWWRLNGDLPVDRPGVFEKHRIFEPDLRPRAIDAGIGRLQDYVPAFRAGPVVEQWTGAMSMSPDMLPFLGEVPSVPGLVLATGLFHGLTVGPAVGEIVASLIDGKQSPLPLDPFRSNRFA